jgi:hypothetical protein
MAPARSREAALKVLSPEVARDPVFAGRFVPHRRIDPRMLPSPSPSIHGSFS